MTHRSIYIAALLLTFSVAGATAHGRVGDDELSNDSILASLHSETLKSSKDAQSATLSECLEKGLDKNYSLRIIRNKEQMAANNATMENAGMLPSVSLSAGYNGSAYSRNTSRATVLPPKTMACTTTDSMPASTSRGPSSMVSRP